MTAASRPAVVLAAAAVVGAATAGCGGASSRPYTIDIAARGVVKPGEPVRVLGQREGTVDAVKATVLPNGRPGSVVRITVDTQVDQLPVDSTAAVRRDGIDLVLGRSARVLPTGGTLPVSQTLLRLGG
jgi:ABC-type transporter Mla subunit MlaD